MKKIYFHGDVTLIEVDNLPKNMKKVKRDKRGFVLAEGEVSGHYHAVKEETIEMYEKDGITYIQVNEPTEIFHQEHKSKPINLKTGLEEKIKKGIYKIDFPREFDHFEQESRRVID